jgi:hypothetical protein
MCHLSITREGEWAGAMVLGPHISVSSQTAAPFQFPYIFINGCSRWPCRLFLFTNPVAFQFKTPSPFNFQTPPPFYFLPVPLMVVVCLMLLLLPDDLITETIIHSIKAEPVIRFLILRNQI